MGKSGSRGGLQLLTKKDVARLLACSVNGGKAGGVGDVDGG